MLERLAFGSKGRCIDIAVDTLAISSNANKTIAELVTTYTQMECWRLEVYATIEFYGIEAITLRQKLWTKPAIGSVLQLSIESAGILTRLFVCMGEVEVHKMLVAAKHLVAEGRLRQTIQTFVGHCRVLAYLTLPKQLSNELAAMKVAPPLKYIRRVIDVVHV